MPRSTLDEERWKNAERMLLDYGPRAASRAQMMLKITAKGADDQARSDWEGVVWRIEHLAGGNSR